MVSFSMRWLESLDSLSVPGLEGLGFALEMWISVDCDGGKRVFNHHARYGAISL